MKIRVIVFGLLLNSLFVFGQQEAQYTQYMYNTANINPGYTGSRGVLSILAMHRNQWVGLDGAPVTNTVTAHTPMGDNSNIGLGFSFVNDALGPSNENTISVDFSYTIPTSKNYKLAFGLKGTADWLNIDFTKLSQYKQNDPLANKTNIDNRFNPNIGVGSYWYSNRGYFGLSIPYILERSYYDNDVKYTPSERMHFHIIGGYVFNLRNEIKFKPAVLSKVVKGAPLQLDLSANFLFFNKFSLGGAYRWSAATSFMAGFQVSEKWTIGYAYDLDTTRLGQFNSGSHEVFLRWEPASSYNKVVSPRFF